MLSNIKARILKYFDLSWKDRTLLKAWSKLSASFNSFDPENFSATSLRVAKATTEDGEPIAFCPIATAFIVSSYAVNPALDEGSAQRAGNLIDWHIEQAAQLAGISRCLVVLPSESPQRDAKIRDHSSLVSERQIIKV